MVKFISVGLSIVFAWSAIELYSLLREQQATIILEQNYKTRVSAFIFSHKEGEIFGEQTIDLKELQRGRLYVPVDSVSFFKTTIDRHVWKQLACFRHMKNLKFQDCRIESGIDIHPANINKLEDLQLWNTSITVDQLRDISRLKNLELLTLDGTGLKGNWLDNISRLNKLFYIVINNGDLSDGSAESLARMKGLTCLQLENVKIDSEFGPALAKLEKLEALALSVVPQFDDEGMKHLSALEHLRILCLGENAITDKGLASLANLPNLWELSLVNNKITDAGLKHLSKLPKLERLALGNIRVTNSCLPTLAAMPSLKVVLLVGTDVDASAPGFIGVRRGEVWYPDEETAKEMSEESADAE